MAHVFATLRSLTYHWPLVLVLLLAAGLRIWSARESLWVDELHTSWVVADEQTQVAPRAKLGNHSPLYFQMVWLATRIGGVNEWGLRSVSLLAGLALIATLYALIYRWTGQRTAAWMAATVAALDTNLLFFSVEARPYAVLQLAALLHIALVARRFTQPLSRGLRITFVLLGAGLVYLHYTAGVMLIAETVIACLLLPAKSTRRAATALLIDIGLALLLCLGALPHALEVAEHRSQWSSFVRPAPLLAILTQLRAIWYAAPPVVAAAALGGWFLLRKKSPANANERRYPQWPLLTVIACWWLVPVTLTWLLTEFSLAPLFLNRYLMISAAAPIALSAVVASRFSRPVQGLVAAAVIGVALWANHYERMRRPQEFLFARGEDWRGLVTELRQTDADRRQHYPILLHSGLIEADRLTTNGQNPQLLRDYCRLPVLGAYDLSSWPAAIYPLRNSVPYVVDPAAEAAARSAGGLWLIVRGRAERTTAIVQELRDAWPGADFEVRATRVFGRVRLVELQRKAQ